MCCLFNDAVMIYRETDNFIVVNTQLAGIWKETLSVLLRFIFGHLPREMRKITKNPASWLTV